MKTAISIPDHIFEAAEQLAQHLGMSRRELYTTAVAAYIVEHWHERVTEQLDQVYGIESSVLDETIQHLQMLSLPQDKW